VRRFAPALLGVLLLAVFFASALDPRVQLYYRDTGRLYYPVKLYIARALRSGRLPLWDEMTESGVSLLGQLTPGMLHPATLLYLVFPFDLAFKLNHFLGPTLGAIGAWLLARRLGASPWARLTAAVAYGGCGYLISVTGSNLPYALGAGTVPLAVDGVLGFVERRTAGRLGWAGATLASIGLAGEPQSLLIAGLIAGGWSLVVAERPVGAARNLALVALCGAIGLMFVAPAALPALVELRRSSRAAPMSMQDQQAFANHPVRLLGLLVPRAFDDRLEAEHDVEGATTPYSEYFATTTAPFADSIIFGAPALLLAAMAAGRRRGRVLLGAALVLALASTGEALGVYRAVFGLVPLAGLFRFAEKLTAPASLLFALAAAVGVDEALAGSRRAAWRLAALSVLLAASSAAAALAARQWAPQLAGALVPWGRTHSPRFALEFLDDLQSGLFDAAGLSAVLGVVAAWRALRELPAAWLGMACCAASVMASSAGLLYSAPLRFLRGPFDLAERLKDIGGPSPGRWRLFVNNHPIPGIQGLPPRLQITAGVGEALMPQFETVAGIDGMAAYFSAADPDYVRAISEEPEKCFDLFGVRFVVEMPAVFSPAQARERGFHKMGLGYWVREYPTRVRAFVVQRADRADTANEASAMLGNPQFAVRRQGIMRGAGAPASVDGRPSDAVLERPSPERMRVHAEGPGLLVIAEHFDPGWRASVNGAEAPVLQADLTALGVVLPPGPADVQLRFVPPGFRLGLALQAAAAIALAGVAWWRRRR